MVPSIIMASRPGPEDYHTTSTMFDCWYDVLFMKCGVGFMPDVTVHTPSKKFNICLISPQNICPKVFGIIKIFLANVWRAFVFFLVNSGFCLETLQWMPFLPSLFLIVESWTLTLIEASEACSSLNVVLFFYDLLEESSSESEWALLPGMFTHTMNLFSWQKLPQCNRMTVTEKKQIIKE